ncbi:MAG TPA: hypothetical protein VML01_03955 [Bryobacterales bacterium]|nr:hypothetical protein [Bryobacterales bacterium]
MSWFRRLLGKDKETPLRGARPVRREKTYSADTGYVYQYVYEGYREARRDSQPGHQHVFSVTSDRSTRFPLSVFLAHQTVDAYRNKHGRELNATEQYAIVKMRLFAVFDEQSHFGSEAQIVTISLENIEQHAETLDL